MSSFNPLVAQSCDIANIAHDAASPVRLGVKGRPWTNNQLVHSKCGIAWMPLAIGQQYHQEPAWVTVDAFIQLRAGRTIRQLTSRVQ